MLIKLTQAPRLAQVIHHHKMMPETELFQAITQAKKNNQKLLTYILQNTTLKALAISQACADFFNLPLQELHDYPVDPDLLTCLEETIIQKHHILPIKKTNHQLQIAIADPDDLLLIQEIQLQIGHPIQAVISPYDQLLSLINQLLSAKNYQTIQLEQSADLASQSPAVVFVKQILNDAIHRQASDIHCEPLAENYRIRMRIDGLLHEITIAPSSLTNSITTRLKVLAECDISEKRLPQDGRFTFTTPDGKTRDCRLSSCPTLFGEKIVIRLLDSTKKLLNMEELGLNESDQLLFLKALSQPQGLILVTGPTGSGKTITLYTALQYLNRTTHNISTIEEPVEIQLPGINQVNIQEKSGLTFATALRAFLRQDPDIIMVGEIRDKETADIAIRAAQTGHLVLSTLHTNSAPDTVIRLLNMGIAPINVATSIRLIIAQRLARKCCDFCRDNSQPGCHYCFGGYQGRTAIFSLLPISKNLSQLIMDQGSKINISQYAEQEGMKTLWQAALLKVQKGHTRVEEISRVVEHE